MLLIVCGCGPTSHLGVTLLHALCEMHFGRATVIAADTAEALRAALASRADGVTIVHLEAPERAIVEAVLRARRAVLLFDDGFADAVAFAMARHGAPFVVAARHVAMSVAATADLATASETRRIAPSLGVEALAHALCRFAGIAPCVHDLDAALSTSPAPAVLSPDERTALDALAPGYDALVRGDPRRPIVWPTQLFLQADRPDTAVRGPLDLTGRARLLTYGPYLHLPTGGWVLRAELAIEDNRSGNRIEVAVLAGGARVGVSALRLPVEGRVTVDVPFAVAEPRAAIEVYCTMLEGAIEGTLDLAGVELWRPPLNSPEP